ncbi:MAG: hypothetical protein OXU23_13740 [Candidatus Poribacteria bacterium]|nr:hypothetical protein [Candidatus Poribacteria bacterium]
MKYLKIFVLLHIRILFLSCCLLLFACATCSIDAKIVFVVDDDIYVMNDDGTNRRRLTRNTVSQDTLPRWSPDGKRIAFIRQMIKFAQHTDELFVMNADGTDLQRLTHDKISDSYPSWSPDGKKIAFRSQRSGDSEVHVIDLETLAVTRLTGVEGEHGSTAPDWSPDGTQIVYEKFGPGGHKDIFLMSANGEDQHPLFPDPQRDAGTISLKFHPRWSSDGQRIVFFTWKSKQRIGQLIVAQLGGEGQEITAIDKRFGGSNWQIAVADWMDNDRAMVFALRKMVPPNARIYNLYKYEFKTRRIKQLTRDTRDEKYPDWIADQLSVSPKDKLPTQLGEKKQDLSQ